MRHPPVKCTKDKFKNIHWTHFPQLPHFLSPLCNKLSLSFAAHKRPHKNRNTKHRANHLKNYSNRPYFNGVVRYHENQGKSKHYSNDDLYTLDGVQKFEDNYQPPYIKKFNRRNKQLMNLLEGIPEPHEKAERHSTKKEHNKDRWVETNLFEEQRPSQSAQNTTSSSYELKSKLNEIPEENGDSVAVNDETNISKESTKSIRSKVEKFSYHRVASPKLVGFGSFGMLKKQQLPFVAITDKRLSHSNSHSYSQQPSNLSKP